MVTGDITLIAQLMHDKIHSALYELVLEILLSNACGKRYAPVPGSLVRTVWSTSGIYDQRYLESSQSERIQAIYMISFWIHTRPRGQIGYAPLWLNRITHQLGDNYYIIEILYLGRGDYARHCIEHCCWSHNNHTKDALPFNHSGVSIKGHSE